MKRRDDGNGFRSAREQMDGLGLFDQLTRKPDAAASVAAGKAGLAQASTTKADLIDKLVPLARELARKAGNEGIIPADVRFFGEKRGLLPEKVDDQRFYSFLPTVMRRAGLVSDGSKRPSFLQQSHGNEQLIYRFPRAA